MTQQYTAQHEVTVHNHYTTKTQTLIIRKEYLKEEYVMYAMTAVRVGIVFIHLLHMQCKVGQNYKILTFNTINNKRFT